jgi:hypothetical protein
MRVRLDGREVLTPLLQEREELGPRDLVHPLAARPLDRILIRRRGGPTDPREEVGRLFQIERPAVKLDE